ncbi:MAG: hypothetical protein M3Z31_14795 [Pseudomonadota bacterium]|nr:hypothetical protein [Pseudomonadota bacterium]
MPTAIIIPFPGPKGRRHVTQEHHDTFVERFLHARAIDVNESTRAVVSRAIVQFPGGLPALRIDLERFIDFVAGPRLRRLRGRVSGRDSQ